jgi:protein-tyrosine phosphatase
MGAEKPQRLIQLETTLNLRDLGGYRTKSGQQTRWHRLLRSDNLNCITSDGLTVLLDYGLGLIIDLRADWELENFPYKLSEEVSHIYRHLPLYLESVRLEKASDLTKYYQFVLEDCRIQILHIFEAISSSEPTKAVLFHCASGKDRTGLVAALLLALAGVEPSQIAEDYALSATYLEPRIKIWREEAVKRGQDMENFERDMAAKSETALDTLKHLDITYGGVECYLSKHCSMPVAEIEQLKASLIQ